MAIAMAEKGIFESFRALGVVADDVPFVINRLQQDNFVVVSIGKAFQIYKADKLQVALVSPQLRRRIRAIVVRGGSTTFTAVGRQIIQWDRTRQKKVLEGHSGNVNFLLSIGHFLVSVCEEGLLAVWNSKEVADASTKQDPVSSETLPADFSCTFVMHPDTYLNKILLGSEEGKLLLWNIRRQEPVHTFEGWGSPVRSIAQSPAVDVVAVGLANGRVVLHNLKFDETLMTFNQAEGGEVTSVAFRTDTTAKVPLMACGSTAGDVFVWDLEGKQLQSVIREAHEGKVTSVSFLQGQPLLITAGTDNCLKMWIFDRLDGSARLLKSREGHRAPPTRIRYYGATTLATTADGSDGNCCQLLSAGLDRAFRVFHTAREQQSRELSQGHLVKKARKIEGLKVEALKLPPIAGFAAAETRQRDWANVVTCHEGERKAYVWSFERRAIGKHVLAPADTEEVASRVGIAKSVAISACGNFGLVGMEGGCIYKYNLQSGQQRGVYPLSLSATESTRKIITMPKWAEDPSSSALAVAGGKRRREECEASDKWAQAHAGGVTGLGVDALNRTLVSAGLDGTLKFWNFLSHELVDTVDAGSPVSQLEIHRDSGLVAVACDDFVIRIFDMTTRRLVRRFSGHTHRITDLNFSPDARWLLSSSMDCSVRVWDLPNGRCIDWMTFRDAVTGLTMSPTGEFLATSHVGRVGIYMWLNRSRFEDVYLDSAASEALEMELPAPKMEEEEVGEVETEEQDRSIVKKKDAVRRKAQAGAESNPFLAGRASNDKEGVVLPKATGAATFSTLPAAHWQTLMNLELIKARNKPKEPPKAPEKAPFFLPTVYNSVNPAFAGASEKEPTSENKAVEATSGAQAEASTLEASWEDTPEDDSWTDSEEQSDDVTGEGGKESALLGSRIFSSSVHKVSRCRLAELLSECGVSSAHALNESEMDGEIEEEHEELSQGDSRVLEHLKSLGASAVDVEMQSLCMDEKDEEGVELLGLMMAFLERAVASRMDFEVVQAYVNRFLKLYGEVVLSVPGLHKRISVLRQQQRQSWQKLQGLFYHNLCLVQYFSRMRA